MVSVLVSVRLREPDPPPLGGMGPQPDGSKVNSNALFLQVFTGLWEFNLETEMNGS